MVKFSGVDRHSFDADPDPNFHGEDGPDPDLHQNDVDPRGVIPQVLYWNIKIFLLLVTALSVYYYLYFSSMSNVVIIFCFLNRILHFFGKRLSLSTF